MDARQIEMFLRIVELGSINRAAADLRMSQPSLSRWLAILEHDIGAPLLVRTRRGILLTDAGQVLVDRARPILLQLQGLRDDIGKKVTAQFNLAMPFSLQNLVTAPFAAEVLSNIPEITLRVYEGINNSIRQWMESGVADAAVLVSLERAPDTFSAIPLLREQMMLVGDRHAGLRLDTPVPLSRLGSARLILPGRPNVISAYVENSMKRSGEKYRNRFEAETLTLCMELTRRGLGYTVMPYSAVHEPLLKGADITAAPIRTLTISWVLYVNRSRAYAVSVRRMVEVFQAHVSKVISSGEWQSASRTK